MFHFQFYNERSGNCIEPIYTIWFVGYGINLLCGHLFKKLFGKDMKQMHEFHKVEIIDMLFVAFGLFLLLCSASQSNHCMLFAFGFALNGFEMSEYTVKTLVSPAVLMVAPHDFS